MGLLSFFKKDPSKELKKRMAKMSEEAMHFQRNGKIREYSELMTKVESLQKELDAIEAKKE